MTPDNSHVLGALPLLLLVPLAIAGLALLNTGVIRSRSAAHILVASLCAASVAMLVYVVIGFSLASPIGGGARAIQAAGRGWYFLGNGRFFARSLDFDDATGPFDLLIQLFSVALTAIIPVAGGAERWRVTAVCGSSVLLAGIVYPVFVFWAHSGWLNQIGFIDGGVATIQVVGGLNALCIAWIIGPRQGKFTAEGVPTAMPGHNASFVLFGCILALVGWFGLTVAPVAATGATGMGLLTAINTLLGASAGALAVLVSTRIRFGKPDASLTANGWVTGLVAVSGAAPYVKPAAAILIGLIAGVLVVFAIELLELRMHVDDPTGSISVHAVGGLWGVLALWALGPGQFLAQMLGVATLIGIVLPLSYGLNLLLDRFLPYRVAPNGERQGMDLFELGAGAYPEFVTHREDFSRR